MAEKNREHPGRREAGENKRQPEGGESLQTGGRSQTGLARHPGWEASPFSFMRRFSEEMDRLFEDFGFGRFPSASTGGGLISARDFGRGIWNPPIEVFQRGDELVVRADLPGMNKDEIRIEVTNDALHIEGERRQEHSEEREGRYHTERSYGRFARTIPLPAGAISEDPKATFKDGVLEITMKVPQQSKARQIPIGS
jgi:HSP20 family protein